LTKPALLVLASERTIYEIRLKPLLDALVEHGVIASFAAIDRDLARLGPATPQRSFNLVVAQRNISGAQLAFLKRTGAPFVYDIDDLLTELPANRARDMTASNGRIGWCLAKAVAVTTPNGKLAQELVRSTGVDFLDRNRLLANGLAPPAPAARDWQGRAETLLWVSSDLPLVESATPILARAIAETANELGLRATLVGRFPDHIRDAFAACEHVPWLDFPAYREFLAGRERTIAIAPLPVRSREHQAFTDSKSDIKVVDFLGHGIPAIYSAAFPYRESDLDPRPLVGDDARAWQTAIREIAAEPGRFISREEVARVHRLRAYGSLAAVVGEVIESASGPAMPLPRPSLNAWLRAAERSLRRWRRRG